MDVVNKVQPSDILGCGVKLESLLDELGSQM
jgi:hypothetical protein